ncbi:MAG: hypothetical protein Q7R91_01615 [bacterium]|nr:hypothetical protein [bacterium]
MPPKEQTESQKAKGARAAQEFLAVDAIRDGIIILKNNEGMRAVIMASSLNFALKSAEEQDAIIFQYENFLNSIDFPLQFVIQSRRLNILPYIELLKAREKEEFNELLKIQIGEYIEFIKSFVELTNVVTKTFFVVIPFTPTIAEKAGVASFLSSLIGSKTAPALTSDEKFYEYKNQLTQRTDAVSTGLRRIGLRSAVLNTEELIELFYGLYNPAEAERQKLSETK